MGQADPGALAPWRRTAAALLAGLLCGLPAIFAPAGASGAQIDGVQIPDTLKASDSGPVLVLNGAGMREKFFFDIYVGALYLPSRTQDAQAILASSGPAAVLMHFVYSEVSRAKITAAWEEGLAANQSPAEMQALRPQLAQFNALFPDLHRGQVVEILHESGKGTEVRIDGKQRGRVAGDGFFRALLRIWLGQHPVTEALKRAMLGLRS